MRIMVLTTTARITADWVRALVDSLALEEPADVVLVAVTAPRGRLPVARCLVVGPFLRPGRAVREVGVLAGRRPPPRRGRKARAIRRFDRAVMRLVPARWSRDRMLMLSTGTTRSAMVREEFARADLVIAHDYNTTWAAWLLARKIPGPHVTFEVEGAALWLAENSAAGQ